MGCVTCGPATSETSVDIRSPSIHRLVVVNSKSTPHLLLCYRQIGLWNEEHGPTPDDWDGCWKSEIRL